MFGKSTIIAKRALPKIPKTTTSSTIIIKSRQFAALTNKYSSLFVNRKGEQVPVAPKSIKTISKTSQGVTVATYDDLGPISTLAIVLGGGSRHDYANNPGCAQLVKATLIRNLPNDNIERNIREVEFRGNLLSTELTRENILVKTEFLRDDLVDAAPFLIKSVFNPQFFPYELLQAIPKVVEESKASLANPSISVLEALHRIAFRAGLGNPLFASEEAFDGFTRASISCFVSEHFSPDRTVIVGVGVAHNDLVGLVEGLLSQVKLGSGATELTAGTKATSKYHGGETQIEGCLHDEAHLALAFPGVSFTSSDYPASLVLRALLDSIPRITYSAASKGALASLIDTTPASSISGLHASYTDAGLIGFYAKGHASNMKNVAQGAVRILASLASNINEGALARAKKIAIVDAEYNSKSDMAVDAGKQILSSIGGFHTSADLASAISKVSAADVTNLASVAVKAKPSLVTYGNTLLLPYLDDLEL